MTDELLQRHELGDKMIAAHAASNQAVEDLELEYLRGCIQEIYDRIPDVGYELLPNTNRYGLFLFSVEKPHETCQIWLESFRPPEPGARLVAQMVEVHRDLMQIRPIKLEDLLKGHPLKKVVNAIGASLDEITARRTRTPEEREAARKLLAGRLPGRR